MTPERIAEIERRTKEGAYSGAGGICQEPLLDLCRLARLGRQGGAMTDLTALCSAIDNAEGDHCEPETVVLLAEAIRERDAEIERLNKLVASLAARIVDNNRQKKP